MKNFHKYLLTAGLLAGLGFSAIAQMPQGGAGGPMDPARMQQRHARMEQRMQERLDYFKYKLKITPAQEGAWGAWTAAIKPSGNRMQRPDRAEIERLSTPERIDRMRALRATRQAEMDRRLDATKVFYATLNPDQKKLFDSESLRMLGGGRHGGEHGGRGGFGGERHHRG